MPAKRKTKASPLGARSRTSKLAKAKSAKPAGRARPAAPKKGVRVRGRDPGPMFRKIAFTLFAIKDPTRARAFYEDVLGLTRGLASPDGTWTEYDLPDGGCLALFRHPEPTLSPAPGGASVAFEVTDLDALNERLRQAGVVYQGDMVRGPRCRMSNILDSEGNTIILHQLDRA